MLHISSHPFSRSTACKRPIFLLQILWVGAILFGAILGFLIYENVSDLMYSCMFQPFSALGLVMQLFSVGLFVLGASFRKSYFLYALLFFDAVSCGFSIFCIAGLFYNAAWLMYILVCFSDIVTSVLLLWLTVHRINFRVLSIRKGLLYVYAITLLLGIFNYACISPFIIDLLNHR